MSAVIIAALSPILAHANPHGAQIISGQVTIDQSVAGITTVINSPSAIINWQDFNIAQNEITRFIQQNGQSAVLNRIIGGNPSEILGSLFSNGKVFLINPNGIVFGAGAQIDTQGLIASSLNLSDSDFQKGNFHFIAGSKSGDITNEGIIHAGKDGNIVLIAPNIENKGIIHSEGGKIVLAAGQELVLTSLDDPEIRFQVQAPKNYVLNIGQLLTEGGAINVFAGTLKHSGDINADSVEIDKQGNIRLVAKGDVTLEKNSKTSASNEKGVAGKIEITGENVAVLDNSKIEAVGKTGGGEILIGGDYQGKNLAVQNAQTTTVAEKVEIKADAIQTGNGGKVVVWSDENTKVAANISANGGKKSGNGGLVETSGKHLKIADTTKVSTKAPKGKTGTWLLDPADFTIDAGSGTQTASSIGATTLSTNLSTTSSILSTTGNVQVNSLVSWSANKLTLSAGQSIYINSALDGSGTAQLALEYGQVAIAAGNPDNYYVQAPVNLPAGNNFSTKLGSDGSLVNYTVITDLGVAGDSTSTTLQGMKNALSGNFALGGNIDASLTSSWNTNAGFEPIGNSTTPFTGKFDGLGHTISNLAINRPATEFVGLFGYAGGVGISAEIRNIGLIGGSVTGLNFVGELVGANGATISNSYSTGSVSGTTYVGGLAGENGGGGAVANSYSIATVSGSSWVGGLIGENGGGTLLNSYSTGSVTGTLGVGGLIGNLQGGSVTNSYSTGNVSGTGNNIGGLIGDNSVGTVTNSFWDTQTSGKQYGVGSAGSTTVSGVTGLDSIGMMTQSTYTNAGWDMSNTWWMSDTNTRPFLRSEWSTTITNAHQLQLMSSNLSASYTLANNLDLAAELSNAAGMWNTTKGFVPVGDSSNNFTGNFDGLAHTINNLTINRSTTDNVGLFGYINNSIIGNIGLVSGNVTGHNQVGNLIGRNDGGTVNNSYSTGFVSGYEDIGGLAGVSFFASTINNSYSSGTVSGTNHIGGLLGGLNFTSSLNNGYSTGLVSGSGTYVGGLIGQKGSGDIITDSFWDTQTSGQSIGIGFGTSTGVTGLTTSQIKSLTNFTNWDFANTWSISNGSSYPHLIWQGLDVQTISGSATGLASKTLNYAVDGVSIGNVTTDASGNFSINSHVTVGTGNLLVWLSGDGTNKAATLTNGSYVTDLKLELNTVYGQKDLDTSALKIAKGSISNSDIPFDFSGITLTPATGATSLNLKANNDVIVNNSITSSGTNVSIKAGKSVEIGTSVSINTNNTDTVTGGSGNIEIIANADTATDGINNAHRDAGQALISIQAGSNLDAGLGVGMVAILMRRPEDSAGISINNAQITTNGAISIDGKSTNFHSGLLLNHATLNAGSINLTGLGALGTVGGVPSSNGILISTSSLTATNGINLSGSTKDYANANNVGVYIDTTALETTTGTISISGTVSEDAITTGALSNTGVDVWDSTLSSGGSMDITGSAQGDHVSTQNHGMSFSVFSATNTKVLSSGLMSLSGTASGSSSINYGIGADSTEFFSDTSAMAFNGTGTTAGINFDHSTLIGGKDQSGTITKQGGAITLVTNKITTSNTGTSKPDAVILGTDNVNVNATESAVLPAITAGSVNATTGTGILTANAITAEGGNISLTSSNSDVVINGVLNSGIVKAGVTVNNGGAISLTAGNDILLNVTGNTLISNVQTDGSGTTTGNAGNITLLANRNITGVNSDLSAKAIKYQYGSTGSHGGNVSLTATTGSVSVRNVDTSVFQNDTGGTIGRGGDVSITSSTDLNVNSINTRSYGATFNYGNATTLSGGGNVLLDAGQNLTIPASGYIDTRTVNQGSSTATINDTSGTVTLKAKSDIILNSSSSVLTGNDAVVLNSDSDVANGGTIVLNSGSSISTNGGAITLGGGANPLTGYAQGNSTNLKGITLDTTSLSSNGGDISLRGKSATGSSSGSLYLGVYTLGTTAINSGTGQILIDGTSIGTGGANDQGVNISSATSIVSNKTTGNAIAIVGNASVAATSLGLNAQGQIIAPNGGDISLTGIGNTSDATYSTYQNGILLANGQSILASTGAISLTGAGRTTGITGDVFNSFAFGAIGQRASSLVPNSSSNITLNADTLNFGSGGTFQSGGALVIQPVTANTTIGIAGGVGTGTLQLPASYFATNFVNGFSNINIGNATTGAMTLGGALTVPSSANLTLQNAGDMALNGALTLATNKALTLNSTGNVTQTAPITATNLLLLGAGNFALNNLNNVISNLAANGVGNLEFINNNELTIGTVENDSGIEATGKIDIATMGRHLNINDSVHTSNTTSYSYNNSNPQNPIMDAAIKLNADKIATTDTTNNIHIGFINGSTTIRPIITTGTGGTALLLTGSISGTPDLSSLVQVPVGNFRYNSDESVVNFTTPITSGLYAIYREQPLISFSIPSTYSDTYDAQPVSMPIILNNASFPNQDGTLITPQIAQMIAIKKI